MDRNTVPFNTSSSKPHYNTPRILGRRFPLTSTAYKYLNIGINVGPTSFVELFISDKEDKYQLILSYATWKTFIEKRVDIERLLWSPMVSSLLIGDLELKKMCNIENTIKLKSRDTDLYMILKPPTVEFIFKLEHCIEHVYIGLNQNIHDVNKKFNKFVTILHQNGIINKRDAVEKLREIYDKTSLIECELVLYASDNILNNALHKK